MTVKIIPKAWAVERAPDGGGDLLIKVNEFVYLTLHYDYGYTCNATQWEMASLIVSELAAPGDTISIDGKPYTPVAHSDAEPEPFDNVMLAFYNLHSAYANRFFDKDGPEFQAAYDAADKILGKWQRGELSVSKDAQPDAGPDAGRIAELEREIYTLRANLVECADTLSAQQFNQAQQKRIEACHVELAALAQADAEPQDVLTTVRKRIELVINEIADAELIAMLRTAMRELDLALAQSGAEPVGDLFGEIVENYRMGIRPIGQIDEFFGFPSMTAPPRPDASEMDQLKADLRNTYQRLETTQASEEGWKKRCQFVEAERDDARASRSPDASAGLIEAAELDKMAREVEDNLQYNDYNGQQYSAMRHRNREVIRKALSRAADRSGE